MTAKWQEVLRERFREQSWFQHLTGHQQNSALGSIDVALEQVIAAEKEEYAQAAVAAFKVEQIAYCEKKEKEQRARLKQESNSETAEAIAQSVMTWAGTASIIAEMMIPTDSSALAAVIEREVGKATAAYVKEQTQFERIIKKQKLENDRLRREMVEAQAKLVKDSNVFAQRDKRIASLEKQLAEAQEMNDFLTRKEQGTSGSYIVAAQRCVELEKQLERMPAPCAHVRADYTLVVPDMPGSPIGNLSCWACAREKAAVEQLEVQLSGCAAAALGWNQDPAKQGDYGWSPAYQDVLNLRKRMEAANKDAGALAQWLGVTLDQVDYTNKACGPTEMVAAALPVETITSGRPPSPPCGACQVTFVYQTVCNRCGARSDDWPEGGYCLQGWAFVRYENEEKHYCPGCWAVVQLALASTPRLAGEGGANG